MNKLYRIGDDIKEWYIATSKKQLLDYYHKETSDDLCIEDIEEELNFDDGYYDGSCVTQEDINNFLITMQEELKEDDEDAMYYPQENDECGDIRYYDGEYWKWRKFKEVIKEYKNMSDVTEPEKICSTEY